MNEAIIRGPYRFTRESAQLEQYNYFQLTFFSFLDFEKCPKERNPFKFRASENYIMGAVSFSILTIFGAIGMSFISVLIYLDITKTPL